MSSISVPARHVCLILLHETNLSRSFYLQIPLEIINSLCLKPRKYLLYLGWCILGVEGKLARTHGGDGIDTDGGLEGRGIYFYIVADGTGTSSFAIPWCRTEYL